MAKSKVQRVRVCARITVQLRDRLARYSKASGISERTVIEDALQKHLGNESDTELLLRRLDQVKRETAGSRRDLELLSEAFGRYMRLWFAAHTPGAGEAGKAGARAAGEAPYRQFAQHLGAQFKQGHRFIDDLPVETLGGEDDVE
jgi:hypothetical protein